MEPTEINAISGEIVDAAMKIHRQLGPGLAEKVCEVLLAKELRRRGLKVDQQLAVPLRLDGVFFPEALRLDLLVEDTVVVEVKSVQALTPRDWRQTLTYLRLMDLPLGLLINFGEAMLKQGLHRIVNAPGLSLPRRLRERQGDIPL